MVGVLHIFMFEKYSKFKMKPSSWEKFFVAALEKSFDVNA
jgi:hypothetical protein